MQVENLKYKGTILRVINDNGVLWFRIKDIATILGAKNPRQLVDTYCNKEEEREFPSTNHRERRVNMIHINLANVMKILSKSNYEAKTGFLEWIKLEAMPIAATEPIASANEPIALFYGDKSVQATIIEGDIWFMLTDVTLLLGYTNPRYLLAGIGDKLVKRLLPGKAKDGAAKKLIHVNTQSFQALIEKSKYSAKPELLAWLEQEIVSLHGKQDSATNAGKHQEPKPVISQPTTMTAEPSSAQSNKRKPRMKYKGYAIKVEDYAKLAGKSNSTIYKWIEDGKLEKIEIDQVKYYKINEYDYHYKRIKGLLENRDNNPRVVAELTLEIISSIES